MHSLFAFKSQKSQRKSKKKADANIPLIGAILIVALAYPRDFITKSSRERNGSCFSFRLKFDFRFALLPDHFR